MRPINLLPSKELGFSEKVLNWALTFGRYIIIGTEIVVLVVFLSRFKLDRDRIDLKDSITEKQKILATLAPINQNVTRLQTRLSEIKRIEEGQGTATAALPNRAPLTPTSITYKSIIATGDKLTIIGNTLGTADISQFVASLKASPIFKEDTVSLEKIERSSEDETLRFTVTAVVKKERN